MRVPLLALAAALMAGSALAQDRSEPRPGTASPQATPAPREGAQQERNTGRSPGPPLDARPHTPQANAAHRGGGAVLEGAPGAPAPAPQPTPPLPTTPR